MILPFLYTKTKPAIWEILKTVSFMEKVFYIHLKRMISLMVFSNMGKKLMESMRMIKSNIQVLSKTIKSQVKGKFNTKIRMISMKEKFTMEKCMEKERYFTQMEIFMKDILAMAYIMGKEFISGKVAKFIKVPIRKA